jgi:hypothetical protein
MESWKEIEGFPEYHVSNQGRVKSLRKNVIMKSRPTRTGYHIIGLRTSGSHHTKSVHRLVANAFIEKEDGKETVDHINRNRSDNRVENLRWATSSEQALNSKPGYRGTNTGEHNITFRKPYYRVTLCRYYHHIEKTFKTLDEAIQFRDEVINNSG